MTTDLKNSENKKTPSDNFSALCAAKTKSGKDCKNKPQPNRKFCLVHQKFELPEKRSFRRWFKEEIKTIFTILGFLALVGIAVSVYPIITSYYEKKQNATSGEIKSIGNIKPPSKINKWIVINTLRFEIKDQESGILLDGQKPVFSVRNEAGKLLVSASVKNNRGDLVAEIKDNVWSHQNKPIIFDRNFTDNALEIRDNEGKVILQVVDFGDALVIA